MNQANLIILVLFYSRHGATRKLAELIAQGIESVPGCDARLRTVPAVSTVTEATEAEVPAEGAPYVEPEDLQECAGIAVGSPTRFGNMTAQMRNFLDQTGGLWVQGGLVGKVGSVFTSTGTGGGNESTIISFVTTLMHHGMIYVGLPYSCPELADITELKGGSPWGAATIAGSDGSRQPSAKELAQARFQGHHVASIAKKLFG